MLGRSNSNKKVKQIIIGCECGCEQAINIVRYEDEIDNKILYDYYITVTSGLFYERQRGIWQIIKSRIKAAWYMLRGKEYLLCDVNIKEEEISKIIESLKEIKDER